MNKYISKKNNNKKNVFTKKQKLHKFYKSKNKSKSKFKTKSKSKKHNNRKYFIGGVIIDESIQIENRDKFRAMFIPNLKKLKDAIQLGDTEKVEQAIIDFKNGFRNQKMGINLRILANSSNFQPIDKKNYSLQQSGNIGLYPSLVIIYENIPDTKIRKKLTESFIKNGGNIHLESNKGKITALSDAIKLGDKSLIQLLLKYGASIESLNNEQKNQMEMILMQTPVEIVTDPNHIVEEPLSTLLEEERTKIEEPLIKIPEITKTKLIIPTELPPETGYPLDVEPEFWIPLFGPNNMFSLREKIISMMERDLNIKMDGIKITEIWSVCKILQSLIPTYFVPTHNNPYRPQGDMGLTFYETPTNFSQYNIILCASLLVFGLLSQKMKYQDYQLIFKGGKAIQLVLSNIPGFNVYESEDIDVLIMPNQDIIYDEIKIKNLSGHIAYLVQWFLTKNISVLVPNPENKRANPFIFKLSYIKQGRGFKAISDIDFREIPETIKKYFERSIEYPFNISELDENVSFKCPDIGSLLDEKIYYYSKYSEFKDLLSKGQTISESGYESLNIEECNRLLDKFKRAIINLNKGLQMSRFPQLTSLELESREIKFLINRLKKFNITNPNLQTIIIEKIYPIKK